MKRFLRALVLLVIVSIVQACTKAPTTADVPTINEKSPEDIAHALVAGTMEPEDYDALFVLDEGMREVIRSFLLTQVSAEEIERRTDLFALVGPGDDAPMIPAADINAAAQEHSSTAPGGLQTAGWYLYVDVPHFSQRDSRWANVGLGYNYDGKSTIGRYGCYLTCITMLYKKWGYNLTPPALNNWSYAGQAHYAFSQCCNGDLINTTQALQYGYMSRPWYYISVDEIWPQLAKGRPVVARTNQYNNSSHFVVIYGHNGARYYVKDPWQDSANQSQPLTAANQFRLLGYPR